MKISIRKIGKTIIEMRLETHNATITEDITDLNGKINPQFIADLENILEELKEHNNDK